MDNSRQGSRQGPCGPYDGWVVPHKHQVVNTDAQYCNRHYHVNDNDSHDVEAANKPLFPLVGRVAVLIDLDFQRVSEEQNDLDCLDYLGPEHGDGCGSMAFVGVPVDVA
jgi:hypothetical protein